MPVRKKRKDKSRSSSKDNKVASAGVSDRRVLEGLMKETAGAALPDGFEEDRNQDPLWQAQELMYDAFEASSSRQRIRLAEKALLLSPLCADAHVMMAEEAAKTIMEEKAYYEAAVMAGEAAAKLELGDGALEDAEGMFWDVFETRPYMRARAGLAECLWRFGEREKAVAHVRDMLRLNPNDNQGMRIMLKSWLFSLNDLEGIRKLLREYDEKSFADWSYSKTLLLFRQSGPVSIAVKALKQAVKRNPFVPDLLLEAAPKPHEQPPHYSIGSKEEALLYVLYHGENWTSTEGALQWMANNR